MNFNILTVVMFGAGAVLIYAGVKNVDPRQVIKDALSGKDNPGAAPSSYVPVTPPEPGTGTAKV